MKTIVTVSGRACERVARGCAGRARRTYVRARSGRPSMAIPPLCRRLIQRHRPVLTGAACRKSDRGGGKFDSWSTQGDYGRPAQAGKSAAGVGRGQVRAPGAASCSIRPLCPGTGAGRPCHGVEELRRFTGVRDEDRLAVRRESICRVLVSVPSNRRPMRMPGRLASAGAIMICPRAARPSLRLRRTWEPSGECSRPDSP